MRGPWLCWQASFCFGALSRLCLCRSCASVTHQEVAALRRVSDPLWVLVLRANGLVTIGARIGDGIFRAVCNEVISGFAFGELP